MTILVGTSSWADKTLIASGKFYPPEAKTPEARLRYYASQFPIVEIDSSYYAVPTPQTAQNWVERTPPGFVFNIKAFRLFTGHQTSPTVMDKDLREALPKSEKKMLYYADVPAEIRNELWRRFLAAVEPMDNAGKLGLVHFQFAPWVLRNRDGHRHIEHCAEYMASAGHTMSVEFRNKTWFDEAHQQQTLDFTRELGAVHTIVDGPQGFTNAVPPVWEVTNPEFALIRLHGRNADTWNIKATTSSERFNYDYPDEELSELAKQVRAIAREARTTHVLFNNNWEDQGQRNGARMTDLLGDAAMHVMPPPSQRPPVQQSLL